MSARVIRARGLVAGLAEGPALVSPDPIYQLYKHGTHPVALVACTLPDPSVVQGAILSGIPVVCQPSEDVLTTLADGEHLRVDGAAGTITLDADR